MAEANVVGPSGSRAHEDDGEQQKESAVKEATTLLHRLFLLAGVVLLAGCATRAPMRPPPAGRYAQSTDSATSGCLRNPACYTTTPGSDARQQLLDYDWLGGSCPSAIVTPQLGINHE